MTLRTGEERILSIAGGSSRSHYVEESFLEEALDLSFDRLLMMMMIHIRTIVRFFCNSKYCMV